MSQTESQDIETATTSLQTTSVAPDNKTRRYDRQLRLWASSGQAALESSKILVISGSGTSASVLKNLVLPGIGHFTILDPHKVTEADIGSNFFLETESVGKYKAEEEVRLLKELNDGVEGVANTSDLATILKNDPTYLTSFTLLIAHNLHPELLEQLSSLLRSDPFHPPLIVVRSAGFLAEFFIQFHEHTIIDSHSETPPSLRIDKPFPALLDHALSLDLSKLDPTDHGHIPYIVILVKAAHEWKASHDGRVPKTTEERKEFKKYLQSLRVKADEENFEEAEAQAYRVWAVTNVPSEISSLFNDPILANLTPTSPPFFHLLAALKTYTEKEPHTLPLSATLPDIKSDTTNYIHLQNLYKRRAEEEKEEFTKILVANPVQPQTPIDKGLIDEFVRNSHGLKVLRGEKWRAVDQDSARLKEASQSYPSHTAIHLAFSAMAALELKGVQVDHTTPAEDLKSEAAKIYGPFEEIEEEIDNAIAELLRAPNADLPTTAAFLGGLVAQEAIKIITKQYVPVKGYCVIDLISSTTSVIGA
ncbi:hypothetical protein SISNIDRAFT_417308 [Sistotremastrum niveocremeum HHB9708]|uniref:NEDD8-activating enzyme E1 regulatory subunit n=1 Tax=Sistotremastrum niveocremeum HHB9708 TaxID=1314777 RepID=A0A164PVM5_9AGAM|nr:hypothetical protein SISNIDRAFT_417308 [Sistotremastrum niveocremeum HHB9708]